MRAGGDVEGGFPPRATQVVQQADPNASSGAGVAPRPTQVLQSGSDFGGRPTIVMPSTATAPSATQVIQESAGPATSGTQVIQSASDASDRSVRGTVVIQNNRQSQHCDTISTSPKNSPSKNESQKRKDSTQSKLEETPLFCVQTFSFPPLQNIL